MEGIIIAVANVLKTTTDFLISSFLASANSISIRQIKSINHISRKLKTYEIGFIKSVKLNNIAAL